MFKTNRPATAIHTDLGAIFVSLELSRSTWVITSLSPGNGETMSKHSAKAGDLPGLFARFSILRKKSQARTGRNHPIITIQEADLDGFWIHRVLGKEGIESHVLDPASIATSPWALFHFLTKLSRLPPFVSLPLPVLCKSPGETFQCRPSSLCTVTDLRLWRIIVPIILSP
jgi:hypothetical protein